MTKFGRIIGTGYNGAPEGEPHCLEDGEDLVLHLALDHCYRARHAEINALRNALLPPFGATLYVSGNRPICINCKARLRESGVTDIRHEFGVPSLDTLAREIRAWQAVTFPRATPASVTEHLRREAEELAIEPSSHEEMADVFHLLVAAAEASGHDLAALVETKFLVNKTRQWQAPDADGVVEHVREVSR